MGKSFKVGSDEFDGTKFSKIKQLRKSKKLRRKEKKDLIKVWSIG